MLDLSPEKLMVLLALGVIVLGPNKLPGAARSVATGLARARRLASSLTDPITSSLAEPRSMVDATIADLRSAIEATPVTSGAAGADTSPPTDSSFN